MNSRDRAAAQEDTLLLGVRGDLIADDDRCESCDLPLAVSTEIERISVPLVSLGGEVSTDLEVTFVYGLCVCGVSWRLVWSVG